MSKEKQIEGMAKTFCHNEIGCCDCIYYDGLCDYLEEASKLYNAGYRKQSEGEWIRKDGFFVCSECDKTKPFAVLNSNIHYYACNYCPNCGTKMEV